MAEKETVILEREYIVPLRHRWIRKAYYRRTPAAIKELKEFVARHMKVEDRDCRKVKLDKWLNVEMWQHSIRKPLSKIKIKAKKLDNGDVKVELAEVPEYWKFKIEKEKKNREDSEKIKKEKAEQKKAVEEMQKKADEEAKKEISKEKEDKKNEKEDEKGSEQVDIKNAEVKHIESKHVDKFPKAKNKQSINRKAMER
jgi:ribosomal protein L31E